jgi:hypothetical protein
MEEAMIGVATTKCNITTDNDNDDIGFIITQHSDSNTMMMMENN